MRRLWKFLVGHFKRWKVPILIIGFIVFLLVTQVLFSTPASTDFFDAAWDAGDLISFVGTITLGIIAISQTEHESKVNDRLMQLEENRYKLEMRPFVILEDWKVFEKDVFQIQTQPDQLYVSLCQNQEATAFCLAFTLTNTTQSYVSATYGGARYVDSGEPVSSGFSYSNIQNKALQLRPGERENIVFYGDKEEIIQKFHSKRIRFQFLLQNRFGERYREDFIALVLIREVPTNNVDHFPPHATISVSNYRIGKFAGERNNVEWERTYDQP